MSLVPEDITKEKIENISNQTGFKIVDTYKKIEELGEEFKDSFDFYCYYIKYNSNKLYSTGYVVVFYDLEKNLFQVFCIGVE